MKPTDYEIVDYDLYSTEEILVIKESMLKIAEAASAATASFAKLTQALEPKTEFETDLLQLIKEQKEEHND